MTPEKQSPWLDSPGVQKRFWSLSQGVSCDVLIVGWGIAGCVSAYQLLMHTDKTIALVDAGNIWHWATWHNAGQIDVFFEEEVSLLIEKFGEKKVKNAYESMFFAWNLLEEIITHIWWQWGYTKYIGYNVYSTYQQYKNIEEQSKLFDRLWLEVNELFLNQDIFDKKHISPDLLDSVNRIWASWWADLIGSDKLPRLFFEATHYALLNSASLCHSIIHFLNESYPERFIVSEQTKVEKISKNDQTYVASINNSITIWSNECLFCTNGYGLPLLIDINYTQIQLSPITWMMAWYCLENAKLPLTISYVDESATSLADSYYYQSVRMHTNTAFQEHSLVAVWGPNSICTTSQEEEWYIQSLSGYITKYYEKKVDPMYVRNGTMWYTETWMRKIWSDPKNPTLRYNIWCNGVGILWSIYGARKNVQQMSGKHFEPTVFDI